MSAKVPVVRTEVVVATSPQDRWFACPVGGARCCRVSATMLGDEWARDVIDYHVQHHHRPWR